LTDGSGDFTAAYSGRRTVLRERPAAAAAVEEEEAKGEDEDKEGMTEGEKRAAERARQMSKLDCLPVDMATVPGPLLGQPVGRGPPFVWTPGQYDSVELSEIRTTSVLDDAALDAVQFARPTGFANTAPRPRASANTAKVLGKSHAGPGRRSEVQLTTTELAEMATLRGTAFSPFAVQNGRPRPEGVTHDAPWDRTQRNVVRPTLWRRPGDDCDRTPRPTTKQGHRPRTLDQHEAAAAGRTRGHSTRARSPTSKAGGGGSLGNSQLGGRGGWGSGSILAGGGPRPQSPNATAYSGVPETSPMVSSGRFRLADGTGVVGGAGRRGGTLRLDGTRPFSPAATGGGRASSVGPGRARAFGSSGGSGGVGGGGGDDDVAPYAPFSSGVLPAPGSAGATRRPGTTGSFPAAAAAAGGGEGQLNRVPGAHHAKGAPHDPANEYVIHADPLAGLQPSVLQLLNEKNIAGRLWPASRPDARVAVRAKFAKESDRYKDADVIGLSSLGPRFLSQGMDSASNLHPTDEVDALSPASLVQRERKGASFPVAPWDGTNRNIAATSIGLWRDPGWDTAPPGGDPRLALRSSTSFLANS